MPKWFGKFVLSIAAFTLIPLAMAFFARAEHSSEPRVSIIPDMDNQPRWKTQMEHPMFADHRASRLPVEGTIARGAGMLKADSHLYFGVTEDGNWAESFPRSIPVTPDLIEYGKRKYTIYCAMCHGADGYGNGRVALRANELMADAKPGMSWVQPLSYHSDDVRARPDGHIYNTIANGIRTMPAYGDKLTAEERWAVVAYVRALQISQYSDLEDVPAGKRQEIMSQTPVSTSDAGSVQEEDMETDADTAAETTEEGGGE